MEKSNAFFKLQKRRLQIEENIEEFNNKIKTISDQAKKQKKGSEERKLLMQQANNLKNSSEYLVLQAQLKTMNYCINTVFYN